ncbi:hypothetical protein Tco_1488806 [Tanacetum coccineum]
MIPYNSNQPSYSLHDFVFLLSLNFEVSLLKPKAFGLVVCELPTNLEVVGSSLAGGICEIGGIGCEKIAPSGAVTTIAVVAAAAAQGESMRTDLHVDRFSVSRLSFETFIDDLAGFL